MTRLKPLFKKVTIEVAYCPVCNVKLTPSKDPSAEYCHYQCPKCYRSF